MDKTIGLELIERDNPVGNAHMTGETDQGHNLTINTIIGHTQMTETGKETIITDLEVNQVTGHNTQGTIKTDITEGTHGKDINQTILHNNNNITTITHNNNNIKTTPHNIKTNNRHMHPRNSNSVAYAMKTTGKDVTLYACPVIG